MLEYREPSIEALRDVVTQRTAVKFRYGSNKNSVLMDLFTASAMVAVYDAIQETDNRAKFERMLTTPTNMQRLVSFSLRNLEAKS